MIIFNPGTMVVLAEKLEVRILQACIDSPKLVVTYEVAWWAGRERKTCWIEENEILGTVEEGDHTTEIGFRP